MSADLLVAYAVRPETIDWDAMRVAADALSVQELDIGAYNCGQVNLTDAELRVWLGQAINALQRELTDGRAVETIEVICMSTLHLVLVAGGMSWGDDPSDAFTALSNMLHFPSVMHAGGFE